MSYTIYYPYAEHAEDIKVLTWEPNYESEYEEDHCYGGYMTNYVHILQEEPSDKTIELTQEFAENVDIIYIEQLDVYAIAAKGTGMDLSADIEMAYLINDCESPIKGDPYYFSKERKEWLEKLRENPCRAREEMLRALKGQK